MVATSGEILRLVETALSEVDERPLAVTIRRTARIASLLGASQLAVRLGLGIKGTGGRPAANAAETRALMADEGEWGQPGGPSEEALEDYFGARQLEDGNIQATSIAELEYMAKDLERMIEGS